MKKVLAAAATLALAGSVNAATVSLDTFSVGAAEIADASADGAATWASASANLGGGVTRELGHVLLAPPVGGVTTSSVVVNNLSYPGELSIANGVGADSEVSLGYIGFVSPDAGLATFAQLVLTVTGADEGNPASAINAELGTSARSISGLTYPGSVQYAFALPLTALSGGYFEVEFNGEPGWDLSITSVDIQYTCVAGAAAGATAAGGTYATNSSVFSSDGCAITPSSVPVPGSLALLGLGLVGLAAGRRAIKK